MDKAQTNTSTPCRGGLSACAKRKEKRNKKRRREKKKRKEKQAEREKGCGIREGKTGIRYG